MPSSECKFRSLGRRRIALARAEPASLHSVYTIAMRCRELVGQKHGAPRPFSIRPTLQRGPQMHGPPVHGLHMDGGARSHVHWLLVPVCCRCSSPLLFEPALLSAAAGAHPSLGSCGMLLGPGHNSRGSCCPRASASIAPSDAAAAPTPTVFLTTKDEDTIAAIVTGEGSLPAAGPHDGWT